MKIDYDVGDLIVSTIDSRKWPIKAGQVFTCVRLIQRRGKIGVVLAELKSTYLYGAFNARPFRKLPRKSHEFFTGQKQEQPADGGKVPALLTD
jgi:hypothetical protein